jgi:lipoate-protein ligase A
LELFPPRPSLARVIPRLHLWLDPVPRDGPENMAVDEWLLESAATPVLRCYEWQPGWGSHGYFIARDALPPLDRRWVRRWSGGGIVDHAADRTYTLVIPRGQALAEMKGAASYRVIHAALVAALAAAGTPARLAGTLPPAAGGECFLQPVEHDVLDPAGRKLAGAGQRRSIRGLLHQGSVAHRDWRPEDLAAALADRVEPAALRPDPDDLARRIRTRYGSPAWADRR